MSFRLDALRRALATRTTLGGGLEVQEISERSGDAYAYLNSTDKFWDFRKRCLHCLGHEAIPKRFDGSTVHVKSNK
ncbi:hypothetical protein Clacol_003890 [Clathrus columnatus]|uniref:Uncharacterized protein n=1 Tax=Clathrus columnatus TaxID=1419009 RepID=A0AAV5AAY7_9AGAM|nr:hypothetical protein Clacol_003890 [Clathrus columnatus]